MGINSKLMHYLLMTLVAVTTVACFEAVGSIIVIAMLIVPAATAHLLTDRLWLMVVLSVLIAIASAVLGHLSALVVPGWFGFADTSTSGMMAVMAGLIFSAVMLFAPKYGVLPRLVRKTESVR
jgi:manganese/zinc/iron transport system permease protein